MGVQQSVCYKQRTVKAFVILEHATTDLWHELVHNGAQVSDAGDMFSEPASITEAFTVSGTVAVPSGTGTATLARRVIKLLHNRRFMGFGGVNNGDFAAGFGEHGGNLRLAFGDGHKGSTAEFGRFRV